MKQRLKQEEKRKETRAKLLLSAERVFNQDGYEKGSVDLIADGVALSKGAFYHHFKSKEAIFLALLEARSEIRIAKLDALIAKQLSCEELQSAIRSYCVGDIDDSDCSLLTVEFHLQACRDSAFAEKQTKLYSNHRERVAALLARLFNTQGRETPPSTGDLADIVAATLVGLSLIASDQTRKRLAAVASQLILGLTR